MIDVPPLTPPDCNLQDFPFMPLDVVRLRDSDLAIHVTGEEFRCAVLLWCASWHQVPAASLPDDDVTLSSLAGFGRAVKEWQKLRAGALRGWVTCSDGRLYHPVVAEKANEAWRAKLTQRWKTELGRIKKHCQRHKMSFDPPSFEDWMSQGCPQGHPLSVPGTTPKCPWDNPQDGEGQPPSVPRETASKGQGEGQGQLKDKNIAAAAIPPPTSRAAVAPPPPPLSPDDDPPDPHPMRPEVRYAVLVRQWEHDRRKAPRIQGNDPRLKAWVDAGLTPDDLREAYDLAVADREAAEDTSPINAGFLDVFVARVLNPPVAESAVGKARAKPGDPLAWATTAPGIEAKGQELGLAQGRDEHFQTYRRRVYAASGLTPDDLARLRADFGVTV